MAVRARGRVSPGVRDSMVTLAGHGPSYLAVHDRWAQVQTTSCTRHLELARAGGSMLDRLKIRLRRFLVRQPTNVGQTLAEYALLLLLVAIAALGAVALYGGALGGRWNSIVTDLPL